MFKIDDLIIKIEQNSKNLTNEFKRLFHGRGNIYKGWEFLTIDSIDDILSIAFYNEIDKELEDEVVSLLKKYIQNTRHTIIILQRRYILKSATEIIVGELKSDNYAIENKIKFKLNLLSNQNIGYFPDMKKGREYISSISKDKNVLNLFSYTCGFSLSAKSGGSKYITNVDMSKGALTIGRKNHHINDFDTKNIDFMPYNILKSFSRIKKNAPYDIIIIDPPTFQRGSFEATKDYNKIIRRLEQLASKDCIVLACLNAPSLSSDFIIDIFKKEAPSFVFDRRLENVVEFEAIDENRSLKNLIFHH